MTELSDYWPFLATFAALAIAGIPFMPAPEEIPTIAAGIWVASKPGCPMCWLILPVCFLGVLTSDLMLYSYGRYFGPRLFQHRWVKKLLPPDRWQRIEHNFAHYGLKVLLLIRWVPAIRSPIFIAAGILRLPLARFLIADGIALVMGHTLLFFLGWYFGEIVRQIFVEAEHQVSKFSIFILILLGLIVIGFLYHYVRKPVATADPHDLPIIGDQVAAKIEAVEKHFHHETQEARPQPDSPSGDGKPMTDNADSSVRPTSAES